MKTTDLGLTTKERVKFLLWVVILLLVAFIFIIGFLSSKERMLKDNVVESKANENFNQGLEVNNGKESILANGVIDTPVMQLSEKVDNSSSWNLPKELVVNAIENEIIDINREIQLEDGTIREATVRVRKLEDNTYNIVDITNNRFVATEGIYKYYYTYNGITKEEVLVVNDQLKNIAIQGIEQKLEYQNNIEFGKQEFDDIIENSLNPAIYINGDVYVINITKVNESNKVVLLLNLFEKIDYIETATSGITLGSSYESLWQENYEFGLIRMLVDLKQIDNNEVIELEFNYNGMNKVIKLKFNVDEKIKTHEVNGEEKRNVSNFEKSLEIYDNLYLESNKKGREEESLLDKDLYSNVILPELVAYKRLQIYDNYLGQILYSNKITSARP